MRILISDSFCKELGKVLLQKAKYYCISLIPYLLLPSVTSQAIRVINPNPTES